MTRLWLFGFKLALTRRHPQTPSTNTESKSFSRSDPFGCKIKHCPLTWWWTRMSSECTLIEWHNRFLNPHQMYTKQSACFGSSSAALLLHHQGTDSSRGQPDLWKDHAAICLRTEFVILEIHACWCLPHLMIRDWLPHLERGHCYTVHLSAASRANLAKVWQFLQACLTGVVFLLWMSFLS